MIWTSRSFIYCFLVQFQTQFLPTVPVARSALIFLILYLPNFRLDLIWLSYIIGLQQSCYIAVIFLLELLLLILNIKEQFLRTGDHRKYILIPLSIQMSEYDSKHKSRRSIFVLQKIPFWKALTASKSKQKSIFSIIRIARKYLNVPLNMTSKIFWKTLRWIFLFS